MKRKFTRMGVAALLLVAIICLWTAFGTHTVTLTEAQIQERLSGQLNRDFPTKGAAKLIVKNVRLTYATVLLGEGSLSAFVGIDGEVRGGKRFSMSVRTLGAPRYESGKFFFQPDRVEVQDFAYSGGKPAAAVSALAERYLSNPKTRLLVRDAAAKMETWITDAAESAATHALTGRPVYELKGDAKGWVIRAALKSVQVEPGRLNVTFSLTQLTVSVAVGLLSLVAAVAVLVFLALNPEWGAAFELVSIFGV